MMVRRVKIPLKHDVELAKDQIIGHNEDVVEDEPVWDEESIKKFVGESAILVDTAMDGRWVCYTNDGKKIFFPKKGE